MVVAGISRNNTCVHYYINRIVLQRSRRIYREGLEILMLIENGEEYRLLDFMMIWQSMLIKRLHI